MASPTTIYVGDLPIDMEERKTLVTEDFLRSLFREAGTILPAPQGVIIRQREDRNGVPYAFAFITFETREMAEKAISDFNYTKLENQPIRISVVDPETRKIRKSGLGNLFIKNLDPSIEVSQLHEAFANFGEIISCKIPTDLNSQGELVSRGYGYVQFRNPEDAQQAISDLKEATINGRPITIEPFRRRQRVKPEETYQNVYIKNLPPSIKTNEDLAKIFSAYGDVQSAYISIKDGKPLPFGFCNMTTHEAAVSAVEALNGKELEGCVLFACRAMKKNERLQALHESSEKWRKSNFEKYKGRNLYVRGFDKQMTDDRLKEIFSEFGEIESYTIKRDESGNSREFGFVCYKKAEDAAKCIKESVKLTYDGKPFYVAKVMPRDERIKYLHNQRANIMAQHAGNKQLMNAMPGSTLNNNPLPMPMQYIPQMNSEQQQIMFAQPMMYAQPSIRDKLKSEIYDKKGPNSQVFIQRIKDISDEQINLLLLDQELLEKWLSK
ncbi:Polyadenylate-binding protein [Histomonas meleagridis]|uniref:Polyadenylate-binding protein n=1 Tax=Histomonas meleagridis TaxID=135588 RepID=UPI00355A7389|nr:Polyadenylate-binding protein [Histomonas meleagridis]KAH0797353.1 Polyadenylate-binding protein [Histomonas meleagridis]